MEVKLRFRPDAESEVTRILTYITEGDHLSVGEYIRLQPDTVGVMVVLRIERITHIKLVAQSVVPQKPRLSDLRLVVLVQPAQDDESGNTLVYNDNQLNNVGLLAVR